LTLYRCVDAVKHDPFAGEAEHRRSDDLGRTTKDRRIVSGRGGCQAGDHDARPNREDFACHGGG